MARYIDIDKAIDILLMTKDFCFCPKDEKEYEEVDCGKYTGVGDCPECWIQHNVEDVAQVIHAKWIPTGVQLLVKNADFPSKGLSPIDTYQCSNCNRASIGGNYCSNCGAIMDKE